MPDDPRLEVSEIFYSIQGESTLSGLPFSFIRLSGCNLHCSYCDTPASREKGTPMSLSVILEKIRTFQCPRVLVTGGEPLLQPNAIPLLEMLIQNGYFTQLETHGEHTLEKVPAKTHIIMDIKTPGSGTDTSHFSENLRFLKPSDEIKFVITSDSDFEWSKQILSKYRLPVSQILFSPAGIPVQKLAERILKDHLNVRLQLQVHKVIWGSAAQGV